MPYTRSRARVAFETASSGLLQQSRSASYKNSGLSYDHKNLIYQAAIFRLCALIEEYHKTFFEDLIFQYHSQSATIGDLPTNLRALHLLKDQTPVFETYLSKGDESSSLKKLQPSELRYKVCVDTEPYFNRINANLILGTQKYPSLKNLNKLYNRIGIQNIMNRSHRLGAKDYSQMLQSFLDVREAISHQQPQPITFIDVKRHFCNVVEFVSILDRIKYVELNKCGSPKFWPC
jgi:hypothetical protein